MRVIITLTAILAICQLINSQTLDEKKEFLSEGDYFFKIKEYQEALFFFKKLYQTDTSNANYNFRVGECYLNIPNQEANSIPYLEKATKRISEQWNPKEISERKAPQHALFYLGNAYRINNEPDKALAMYEKFTKIPYYYLNYNENYIENEIASVERAKIIKDNPIDVSFFKLPDNLNTKSDQYSPITTSDESRIVYLEEQRFYNALMFSVKTDTGWADPINITPKVQSDGNMTPTYMAPDGSFMLLSVEDKNGFDIYKSEFENGQWLKAMPLDDNINSKNDETYASMTADGKQIYFCSDRGSSGKFDIYYSELNDKNEWSKPKNIGKIINTKESEINPAISHDGQTLWFISDDHFKMGGFDIFFSHKDEKGNWSEPENAGYPLNSTGDETAVFPLTEKILYISKWSDKKSQQRDLYKITINDLKNNTFFIPNHNLK